MKNNEDRLADEITARARPQGLGRQSNAGSGGGSRGGAVPATSTRVLNGVVTELWQWGDEWSARFRFADSTL